MIYGGMFKFVAAALHKLATSYKSIPANNRERVPDWLQDRFGPMFYYPTELAYSGEDIVGALTWDLEKAATPQDPTIMSMYQIQVRDDMRGSGIAMALIENAIENADPDVVDYAYDTDAGKKLAEKAASKYHDIKFDIWDSR